MSELKAIESATAVIEKVYMVYRKSEADKVIAELEKEIDELQDKVTDLLLRDRNMALHFNNAVDNLVHNKYKRCLAMAKWSESEENRLEAISPIFDTDKEFWEYASDYWVKWRQRWLKIAEQFKEAK